MGALSLSAKQVTVGLKELANQQESIDGSNAVADEVGYKFTLGL